MDTQACPFHGTALCLDLNQDEVGPPELREVQATGKSGAFAGEMTPMHSVEKPHDNVRLAFCVSAVIGGPRLGSQG